MSKKNVDIEMFYAEIVRLDREMDNLRNVLSSVIVDNNRLRKRFTEMDIKIKEYETKNNNDEF